MSRPLSSQVDQALAEKLLLRIASAIGKYVGCELTLRIFIEAVSGSRRWYVAIARQNMDFDEIYKRFPNVIDCSYSRRNAILKLLFRLLNLFEADSVEELELKLAVFSRKTVEGMLGIKERL